MDIAPLWNISCAGAQDSDDGCGDRADLGEPADDRELEDAGAAAGNHEEHALLHRGGDQLGRRIEGPACFQVGEGDDNPHGDGKARGDGEVRAGAHHIETGMGTRGSCCLQPGPAFLRQR